MQSGTAIKTVVRDLRRFLGKRSWTALLVPSGRDHESDEFICSEPFLRGLVNIRTEDPGLILQLEKAPEAIFALPDTFPAFRTALSASTDWPGVLIWAKDGDSVFLPFGGISRRRIQDRAEWIFSHLATSMGLDLEILRQQFLRELAPEQRFKGSKLTILQLSDIHLGSREACLRIPRVQQLTRNILNELGDPSCVLPVVTGDLMDSPNERNLNDVRSFMDFLSQLGTETPITIPGNHDVRDNGFLSENYKTAMRLPKRSASIHWYDAVGVGVACFDSVIEGRLARGYVGESQLLDMGTAIDAKPEAKDYTIVALIHHHPVAVERPDWYSQPFYERVLGSWFEKTEELEDAPAFLAFVEERRFGAVLHGHKHIPRISETKKLGLPIYGCGSTVGKIASTDGGIYMSINLITVDRDNGIISGRLLAERIPGGGLSEYKRHELVFRK